MMFDKEQKLSVSASYARRVTATGLSTERRYQVTLGALAAAAGIRGSDVPAHEDVTDAQTTLLQLADPAWIAARKDLLTNELGLERLDFAQLRTDAAKYLANTAWLTVEPEELSSISTLHLLQMKHRWRLEAEQEEEPADEPQCHMVDAPTRLETEQQLQIASLKEQLARATRDRTALDQELAATMSVAVNLATQLKGAESSGRAMSADLAGVKRELATVQGAAKELKRKADDVRKKLGDYLVAVPGREAHWQGNAQVAERMSLALSVVALVGDKHFITDMRVYRCLV